MILYSFRRCPYAIRARLALRAAGLEPERQLTLREVSLKAKPPELLQASRKGTVPVLVGPDWVIDQSLAIMRWALEPCDPAGWLAGWSPAEQAEMAALIAENDGPFKHHLDRFKYPDRYGPQGPHCATPHRAASHRVASHRAQAIAILQAWSRRLEPGGWLLGSRASLADWALLPFVRQFCLADPEGFAREAQLGPLQRWLERCLQGPELAAVLEPPWAARRAWRSPGWLYHLALRHEWQEARATGSYRRSTRGLALEQVGFIHASYSHQVPATYARFYRDAGPVVLLAIDPGRLAQAGVAVRPEPAPGSGELFPHIVGALPLEAVVLVERYGV